MKLLIANRGEVAIRVASAAADLEIPTLAIYSEDDSDCLHVRRADDSASPAHCFARTIRASRHVQQRMAASARARSATR